MIKRFFNFKKLKYYYFQKSLEENFLDLEKEICINLINNKN